MKTITTSKSLYRFLTQQLQSKDGAARYPKRLASFASFLIDDDLLGGIERGDLEVFFEGEVDLDDPLVTASELVYLRTVDHTGEVMFPVAKMRLAMWIINAAIEYDYVDHFDAIVAMIRYLQFDHQDCLRYSHDRDGLRVTSGKKFERDYCVRVLFQQPNDIRR